MIALIVLLLAARKPQQQAPHQTAEELEQLKYDSEQRNHEKQKADQIRDQAFLMRKGDENQAQLGSLLKDLEVDKDPASSLPIPDQQAKSEEEAIAHVLRSPSAARSHQESTYQPRRAVQPGQAAASSDLATNPMFVYSRNFGGAKYVDKPQKETVQPSQAVSAEFSTRVSMNKGEDSKGVAQPGEKPAGEKAHLIYSDYPPVTLYEGEMLEAVLVNRIIADTEPSPVVCQLSKDIFDHSARYVVFPASSRIVGLSQVVNYKGANRLFITFHRIILPNGPSIDLPSNQKALKALDETGALGVVSKVDRHWFLEFGTAIFLGVLDGISGAAQRNKRCFLRSICRPGQNIRELRSDPGEHHGAIFDDCPDDPGRSGQNNENLPFGRHSDFSLRKNQRAQLLCKSLTAGLPSRLWSSSPWFSQPQCRVATLRKRWIRAPTWPSSLAWARESLS